MKTMFHIRSNHSGDVSGADHKKRVSSLFKIFAIGALTAAAIFPGAPAASAQDKVTFVTDFGFNGRHAYFYVALEKGYYKNANLDVTIVRGQGSADAVKQVAAGTAQIGFADLAAVILARANDKIPVKMVSVVYAKPPHAIYVLKTSGIKTPKDLEGKRIADTAFSAMPKLFESYAKAAGIDAKKVTWVIASSDALPGMLALNRVDGIGQFIVGEPLLMKNAAPQELVRLGYADVGLDYYSNGIIASDETLKEKGDMVRRFVAATLRGLADAAANPAEAAAIMNKYHKQIDPAVIQGETEIVVSLAQVPNSPLGSIDLARVKKTIDIVASGYELKTPVTAEDVAVADFVKK
jgi:NitT/TauT family transport system substrate-binding protein